MKNNKTALWVILAGLLVIVGTFAFPWLRVQMDQATATVHPPKPVSVCSDVKAAPRFMAYDASTKTDNFGPAVQQRKVSAVKGEFHKRLCTDAALTTAEAAYFNLDGFTFQNYATKAAQLRQDHDMWRATVQKLDNVVKDAKSVTIERSAASYNSLWFTHDGNAKMVPALRQGPIPARTSVVMKVVAQNGQVYRLRLECGFQPFSPHFPNVPHTPTPNHGCTSNCGHGCTSSCTTTNCHTTGTCTTPNCQQTGTCPTHHKCPCVTPTQATQPVPTPAPGDPGVPTHAPSAQPTVPANTSSPAPPTPGGYNGGSTTQPGQSGSPTPVVPSSDPTNTGDPGGF